MQFSLSMVHAFSAITARNKELSLRVQFIGTSKILLGIQWTFSGHLSCVWDKVHIFKAKP